MDGKEAKRLTGLSKQKLSDAVRDGKIRATKKTARTFEYDDQSVMNFVNKKPDSIPKDEIDMFEKNYTTIGKGVEKGTQGMINGDARIDFLYSLHCNGVDIGSERIKMLVDGGFIPDPAVGDSIKDVGDPIADQYFLAKEIEKKNKDIADELSRLSTSKEIDSSDWMPKQDEIGVYTPEFIAWIDSINRGFLHRIEYDRYNKYVKQAKIWLAQNRNFDDYDNQHEQWEFVLEEKRRIKENTLYFLNKYGMFKDEKSDSGARKYTAYDAQQILAFLVDSGYNLLIGKGRQIFFTTTMGLIIAKKTNFHRSHFTKFITEDKVKGEEIFEDKMKFPFYRLPNWIKCSVSNDRDGLFRIARKINGVKGSRGGADSKILVATPNVTAINGGSPTLVALDEIGQIPELSDIINEIMPTLYAYDIATGRQKLTRQLVSWGTGGSVDRGGEAFSVEFLSAMKMWKERKFGNGIVPVFFDFYARPGVSKKYYEDQKAAYYAKAAQKGDKKYIIQFHQHNPITYDDMFLTSSDTIIGIDAINSHLDRIYRLPALEKPQLGYFEPIYDTNKPYGENSFIPFAIIGANFVPTSDLDERTTAMVIRRPQLDWINRYYQGTDPVFAQSGHSKMASAIWDSESNSVASIVNFREHDYRNCYMQCILQKIYYGVPYELVENNVGREYINMNEGIGLFSSLAPNAMLPKHLQTQSSERIGISKKANTAKYIINKLVEMLEVYAANIEVEDLFIQLKTFVKKTTPGGDTSFKVNDPKTSYDDVIDAIIYAYICSQAYEHLTPMQRNDANRKRTVKRYICNASTGWKNVLTNVSI